ncbi:SDR family NAD(P)-dependent oxidoreductase [Paramixta manurensis]|uniref:Probable oxidoreductase n=1 Tax=Paramixta manurensis TaxID=2740817 RepID=A0A6M8UCU6_9GAMM|nr:SDR family NAD(P)-dependent oxidoreductase [Erwiniaceae bacterium PD-1]
MFTSQSPMGSGFSATSTPEEVMQGTFLKGKCAIVTGGHSGIGLETVSALRAAGARVFVPARDRARARVSLAGMPDVTLLHMDLLDPESIDNFAKQVLSETDTVDILINNAGIMAPPLARDARGYESQFSANHLGHFQLTLRLWSALAASGEARVVALSSLGHRYSPVHFDDINYEQRPYDPWRAYGQSKTANALFAVQLDKLGQASGIRAFAVHPGRIPDTHLSRFMSDEQKAAIAQSANVGPDFVPSPLKTVAQGASTSLWAATSPQLAGKGGVYCADCDISSVVADDSPDVSGVRRWAIDREQAERLWSVSLAFIGE